MTMDGAESNEIQTPTRRTDPGFRSIFGTTVLVTGSSGLCGSRLVEMLLERGAKTVYCFDLAPPKGALADRFRRIQQTTGGKLVILSGSDGDLNSDEAVAAVFRLAASEGNSPPFDCVYHIGALVGPFYNRETYYGVNYYGTLRIIENCKKYNVTKLVYSSSPSTRFTGEDVNGLREDELPMPSRWMAMYAEAKAMGEMAVAQACHPPNLKTVSVAPHQVYGPHDSLMLPNILEAAGNGRLRIFGNGRYVISLCYVDNYAHGLMCGADVLDDDNSPALGKFYIVTDGEPQNFWHVLNRVIVALGFTDLHTKFHVPLFILYALAYAANLLGMFTGKKYKLSPFNVRMMTMNRYFSLENSRRDLHYEPLVNFEQGWTTTIDWFKSNWLPSFLEKKYPNKAKKVN